MWLKWRLHFNWESLCPVLFADCFGIVLIMPRADEANRDAIDATIDRDGECHPQPTTEFTPEGYGRIGDHIVCFDYGLADADMVRERRDYFLQFRCNS